MFRSRTVSGLPVVGTGETLCVKHNLRQKVSELRRFGALSITRVIGAVRVGLDPVQDINEHLTDMDNALEAFRDCDDEADIPSYEWCLVPGYRVAPWHRSELATKVEPRSMMPRGYLLGVRVEIVAALPDYKNSIPLQVYQCYQRTIQPGELAIGDLHCGQMMMGTTATKQAPRCLLVDLEPRLIRI